MDDIKVFITIEVSSKDINEDEETHMNIVADPISIMIDNVFDMIKEDVPVQFKITNLPPRRSGFVKASDLMNLEKE